MLRPEILEGGATVGELAWIFGKDRAAIGDRWRHRLWHPIDGSGQLDALGQGVPRATDPQPGRTAQT